MIAPLLKTLLWQVAQRAARDPRVHAKAAQAATKVRPKLEGAIRSAQTTIRQSGVLDDVAAVGRGLRKAFKGDKPR